MPKTISASGPERMLIVSLSTIPPRFDKIGETLKSLLNQSVKADHIYLYIPETYRRFPDWDGQLPHVPDGITIRRTDIDLGPATKVLPAARAHRGAGSGCFQER